METLPLRTTAQTSSKNIVPHQENLSRSQLRSRGLSTDAIAQHPASVFAACRVSDWTLRQFIFAGVSSSLREIFSATSWMRSVRSTAGQCARCLQKNYFGACNGVHQDARLSGSRCKLRADLRGNRAINSRVTLLANLEEMTAAWALPLVARAAASCGDQRAASI
jgi:hypothetical protein